MTSPLAQDLRTAWLRMLAKWWHHYNHEFLRDALAIPVIELSQSDERLGAWDRGFRRIMISALHVERDPWGQVLDTLRHEMAHQFVDEVLRPAGESAHGAAFSSACERLRCSASARSRPSHGEDRGIAGEGLRGAAGEGLRGAAGEGLRIAGEGPQEERVIRLVQKLLSLAQSPNENEAQAAMRKARRLLLEYNIELVQDNAARQFERRQLGEVKGRHPAWELWVAMLLSDFFFVEVLWAHSYDAPADRSGTVLEIYGTRTNLAMAEYVYSFLTGLLPRLWDQYRVQQLLGDNRERMRFFAGVVQGFHEKLTLESRREQQRQAEAVTTALVWHGDQQLRAYYHHHNPRITTRMTGGVAATDAFHHGVAQGRQVTIHQPVEQAAGLGGYLKEARG